MLSIGQLADMAQVSSRTLRYYESIGLLPKSKRGENNYRYFDKTSLEIIHRIRDLQNLGFTLDEIKDVIEFKNSDLQDQLKTKLKSLDQNSLELQEKRERILRILSVSSKIEQGENLTATERIIYMEEIKKELVTRVSDQYREQKDFALDYLKRDGLLAHSEIGPFLEAAQKCIQFARERNLTLGPARGSSPASLSLYSLGLSQVDPMKHSMIPERLAIQPPFFHIDVEYENGQDFVDFCKEINKHLPFGEIQAFKMPLLDIIKNVQTRLLQPIDFHSIRDDSDLVLNLFRKADLEKIFQFDFSPNALVMKYENFLPEYLDLEKITEYVRKQEILCFRDVLNITAVWRPCAPELIERINLYLEAKNSARQEDLLKPFEDLLKPNYGRIIYHEDLIQIVSRVTGWSLARSSAFRRFCFINKDPKVRKEHADGIELEKLVPEKIASLITNEMPWTFCLPHAISFGQFTKQTAILKTLHKEIYFEEIEKFEQKKGFCWDDIGIRMAGVSLHQA